MLLLSTACGQPSVQAEVEQPVLTGEDILTKMNEQMASVDQYTQDTEIIADMQTADFHRQLYLLDHSQVNLTEFFLQGNSTLTMLVSPMAEAEAEAEASRQEYSWQYYTETVAEGTALHRIINLHGTQQEETEIYPDLQALVQQNLIEEQHMTALQRLPDTTVEQTACYVLELTLSPQAFLPLRTQLQAAGVALTDQDWATAEPMTITLVIAQTDFSLLRQIINCDPLFQQWLDSNHVPYLMQEETNIARKSPSLAIYMNFAYPQE